MLGLTLCVQSYARSVYNTLWIPCTISRRPVTFSEGCRCSRTFSLESDGAASDTGEKWLKLDLQKVSYLLRRRSGRHGENSEICSREIFRLETELAHKKNALLPNLEVSVFIHWRLSRLLFNPPKTEQQTAWKYILIQWSLISKTSLLVWRFQVLPVCPSSEGSIQI